jgi:hypothetical protein
MEFGNKIKNSPRRAQRILWAGDGHLPFAIWKIALRCLLVPQCLSALRVVDLRRRVWERDKKFTTEGTEAAENIKKRQMFFNF